MWHKKRYLFSLFLIGLSFTLVAKPKPSLLDSLLAVLKGVEDYKYIIYYNIGATYQDMGDDLNSIANFEKSNEVALKYKQEMPYSYSCFGIGTLLAKRKQYKDALHYYEEALKYSENSKDDFKIGINHEKAQEILGKSLENKRLEEVNTLVSKQNSTLYKVGGILLLLIGFLAFSLFKIRDLFQKERVVSEKLSAKEQVLKTQNNKLTVLNKQLKAFNFSLAHDIRSGLNSILEQTDKEKDQNNFPAAAVVNAKASYLKNFCENLLTYYSVSNKSAALEEVDMNEVVAAQLKLLEEKIKRANAVIKVAKLPVIYAHNVSVHQLFHNLLENALAFTVPERRPAIDISCEQKENFFHLTVRDNGQGIPKAEQKRIFNIFTKGNDGNTGIGLAICKNVVDYYSGDIWVESTPGYSTAFHFTLPTD